ncbi:MAG: hypothetical protein K6E20_05970 [Acholeplasmatales bacterium]|nr:hypothetical protein [Acholeplasmatales bacterium]
MAYVNKSDALRNLSNPNDFNIYKNMFIKMYDKNLLEKIKQTYNDKQFNDLYDIINNINKIALNIGSNILFDETKDILADIDKEDIESRKIDEVLEVLEIIYGELQMIK